MKMRGKRASGRGGSSSAIAPLGAKHVEELEELRRERQLDVDRFGQCVVEAARIYMPLLVEGAPKQG